MAKRVVKSKVNLPRWRGEINDANGLTNGADVLFIQETIDEELPMPKNARINFAERRNSTMLNIMLIKVLSKPNINLCLLFFY
ncbi:MAG: hypothetical protein V1804_01500 [Patescibacteria group bacterium]